MQQVTIGARYQIVIPKEIRKKLKYLRPGNKVSIQVTDRDSFSVKTDPTAWVKRMSGLMSEAWKNIDPIEELEKMRDEWEERSNKLEKAAR